MIVIEAERLYDAAAVDPDNLQPVRFKAKPMQPAGDGTAGQIRAIVVGGFADDAKTSIRNAALTGSR
jgi:hypothetical protein